MTDEEALAYFPNQRTLASFIARRRVGEDLSPVEACRESRSLLSEFGPFFQKNAVKLIGNSNVLVSFERFGVLDSTDFGRFNRDNTSEVVLLANEHDERFLFVAPIATFRMILDVALGLDFEKLCQDEALWEEYIRSSQVVSELTEVERSVLNSIVGKFGLFFPSIDKFRDDAQGGKGAWDVLTFTQFSSDILKNLGDRSLYWERRRFEIAGRYFPWTLVFPLEFASATPKGASTENGASESEPRTPSRDAAKKDVSFNHGKIDFDRRMVKGTTSERDDEGRPTVEFSVEVAIGETSLDVWKALKPGDVLTTDAPANNFFLATMDGRPCYLTRPGLYQGLPAVQIKKKWI